VDTYLCHFVRKGVIKIGTKLIIQGAELLNCSDGCDPLQVSIYISTKYSPYKNLLYTLIYIYIYILYGIV
jgi:hypothetical protein